MNERLLTASELGELLGFAAGTIVDWFEADKLPGFRIGGRLRFRWSEVEPWLEQRRGAAHPRQRLEHPELWPQVRSEVHRNTYSRLRKGARAAAERTWAPVIPDDAFGESISVWPDELEDAA